MKRWKDIGSGVEVFLCRKKEKAKIMSAEMLEIVATYGEFLVRNGVVSGIKAHIPLTSKFLGKEDYFTDMVAILRKK